MRAEPPPRPSPLSYAERPATKVPNWHGLVVLDVLFNNLSTGLYLVAAVGELLAPAAFAGVAPWAYRAALAFLVADLVCLILDLGDPLRFHHMLRVWKPSSPMSLGTWALVGYSLAVGLLATAGLLPGAAAFDAGRRALVLVGMVPALAVALYKGVLFSTTAQPGWREARWLGAFLLNSAYHFGAALTLVLAGLLRQQDAVVGLRAAAVALGLLHLGALLLVVFDIAPFLRAVRSPARMVELGLVVVGAGILLPMLCFSLGSRGGDLLGLAAMLAGGIMARDELVHLPHRLQHAAGGAAARLRA